MFLPILSRSLFCRPSSDLSPLDREERILWHQRRIAFELANLPREEIREDKYAEAFLDVWEPSSSLTAEALRRRLENRLGERISWYRIRRLFIRTGTAIPRKFLPSRHVSANGKIAQPTIYGNEFRRIQATVRNSAKTIRVLSREAGVSERTISRILRGENKGIRPEIAARIRRAIGIELSGGTGR